MKPFLKKCTFLIFKIFAKIGIYILHNHYYTPISDVNKLEKIKELWAKKSKLPLVCFDLDQQVENLREICLPFQEEYIGNKISLNAVENYFGPGYGFI